MLRTALIGAICLLSSPAVAACPEGYVERTSFARGDETMVLIDPAGSSLEGIEFRRSAS